MGVIVVLLLAGVAVLCALLAILSLSGSEQRLSRLQRYSPALESPRPRQTGREVGEELGELLSRLVAPLASLAGGKRSDSYQSMITRLGHAGFRHPSALQAYMGSRVAGALVLGALGCAIPLLFGVADLRLVGSILVGLGAGFVAPGLFVDARVRRRQAQIRDSLPDVIDLMGVCVEAGLSMGATVARVAAEYAENNPVLAQEFRLVVLETQAGKSTEDALRSLATRTGVSDVSSLVSMLIQTERFGTGLANTLRVHADSLRVARLQRGEELAQQASLKMVIPAAIFIFPAILIVAVGPGLLRILEVF